MVALSSVVHPTYRRDATSRSPYPLRIGLIGDVGQTLNSTDTRDHLADSKPHVVIHVGDNS